MRAKTIVLEASRWCGGLLGLVAGAGNAGQAYRLRRRIFWGLAHAVSIVRIRSRAVVTSVLLCLSASILLTVMAKPAYSSSVMIKVPEGFCWLCGEVHPKDECPWPYLPFCVTSTITTIVAQQQFKVGQKAVVEGASPNAKHAVVFEDDGDRGYFYALDISRDDDRIVDALHIYNVKNVTDRHVASTVQIVWSSDNLKALLLINRYPHAVFDFSAKRGYCRTGLPAPAKKGWSQHGHDWDDKVVKTFR